MSVNNYWIFQGNPKIYDFETGLKNDKLITEEFWLTNDWYEKHWDYFLKWEKSKKNRYER